VTLQGVWEDTHHNNNMTSDDDIGDDNDYGDGDGDDSKFSSAIT
jgi:hypothetical protein